MATTDFGFDFRATLGFVTDPTYAAAVLGEAYPHTYTNGLSNTISAGFTLAAVNVNTRDRSAAGDARLAGENQNGPGNAGSPSFVTFEIALPVAGAWIIQAAFGDQANPQS